MFPPPTPDGHAGLAHENAKGEHAMTYTPWGPSQTADTLAPGIVDYTTASHGGIHLSVARRLELARILNIRPGSCPQWYEEDCDWAIPYYAFHLDRTRPDGEGDYEDSAARTLSHWHPDLARQLGAYILAVPNAKWLASFAVADHRSRCAMCTDAAPISPADYTGRRVPA
jgi:hypothetical protein